MNFIAVATRAVERVSLPDGLTRAGIAALVARADRGLAAAPADVETAFARSMSDLPIALHPDQANAQHYDVPAAFFRLVLGPRQKYSCCLYETAADTLAIAEERALAATAEHAALADGQRILELGCGWGSLSLWMAARFPAAEIVAVSNSSAQRAAIEATAAASGFRNISVVTADMNSFTPDQRFDRIVSVEMFEHMANWRALLGRARGWLAPGGKLVLHVFAHRTTPYRFDHNDPSDWIARHFFTGGIMPSDRLIAQFADLFSIEADWRWSGTHYARTARDWLSNLDRNELAVIPILRQTYGSDARLWLRRWRLFFLATEGLFRYENGEVWGVSHYCLAPA